jgi:hypothetical protein
MNLTDYERVIYRLDDIFRVAPDGLEFVRTHTFFFVVQSPMDIKLRGTFVPRL